MGEWTRSPPHAVMNSIPANKHLSVNKSALPPRVHEYAQNVRIISPKFELRAHLDLPRRLGRAGSAATIHAIPNRGNNPHALHRQEPLEWAIGWVQGVSDYTRVEHFGAVRVRVKWRNVDFLKVSHVGDTAEGGPGWYSQWATHSAKTFVSLSQNYDPQIEVPLTYYHRYLRPVLRDGRRLTSVNLRMCLTSWLVARNNTIGTYKVLYRVDWGFHETVNGPNLSHCANTWLPVIITSNKREHIPERVFKGPVANEMIEEEIQE